MGYTVQCSAICRHDPTFTLKTELLWCQLCRHWWHGMVSLCQPSVSPMTTKLAQRGLLVWSVWSDKICGTELQEFRGLFYRTWINNHTNSIWGGVTKPISSVPLFSEIFSIVKTHVSYWISRLYLTGVAAAQLRWHLSNINVIQII